MSQEEWDRAIRYLYDRRLHHFTASLMEAAGPLTLLGAQAIYIGQPLLTLFLPRDQAQHLAGILENPAKCKSFIRALRSYKPTS